VPTTPRHIDDSFLALPLQALTDAALQRARDLGATHADIRVEQARGQTLRLRDGRLEGANDAEDVGLGVRVIVDGSWGFAATGELTAGGAVWAAEQAVELARVSRPLSTDRVELAPEDVHRDGVHVSSYEIDPFGVSDADKVALLSEWSHRLLGRDGVAHVDASLYAVKEIKHYADLTGTSTTQQRVRLNPDVMAVAIDKESGAFETMGSVAPPVGRGWEYLTGTGWDWDTELEALPDLLLEKLHAPSVEAGIYDLVIDPTNLWLTIHESVGHATELDRALGYEANYAGTSFATWDKLGVLRYGSDLMHIVGDRVVEHGLSTVGWDDDGVAGQQWDLVKDGTLVGYQLDRSMAALKGFDRSNGCAYADSAQHVPIQRMANVSLQPAVDGPTTEELIAGVERGLYIVGDKSWSIDMQRYNFQFTGQRFFRIESGRLVGQVKDAAYQATTTDFWGSLVALGGEQTYLLAGAFNCGKAQPGQVAAVSHGAPSAVFAGIKILNTVQEAGR
jgi:TldD protein